MQMQLLFTKSMVSVNTHVPQGALDLKCPNQSRKGAWVEFEPKRVKVKRLTVAYPLQIEHVDSSNDLCHRDYLFHSLDE